ncbi:hypothetical protein GCK72_014153 [Caenorhabditis remanei]|uniref:DNA polymerase alpha/delta/epsilon subunit B domain-containing protein n=1 Tax=Caenorhabditis remanei TaxID=31234 RepID=A0A6A5GR84_CAERE|nr:hypothetical protein GCK72_014153 [Caenorhabditis remanei]KAF1757697.1 hypothetical protein GCK72_014153 [Caenorhabditis remanei]
METAWSNILDYKNVSDRYVLTEEDKKGAFARQYFEVYEARVNALKPRIIEIAERDIGKGKFKHISLSDAKQDEEIFVIGVIVKRIAARPSILKSLLNEDKVAYDDYEGDEEDDVKRYAGSSEDRIELESEKQTVRLDGAISMDECATGCCVGVLGKLGKEGVFHVNRLIWPSSKISKKSAAEGTIVFVSGLELTGDMEDDQLTISGLEFMSEWMNSEALGENQCPPIDRVVVIGPIVETKSNGCDVQSVVRTLTLSRTEKQSSAKALITVDKLISSIAEKPLVNTVDVTPGVGDPCSSMWPLPPIHRVCLQRCAMSQKKVNLVTNPYEFEVNGLRVMTMSGENVTELLRTSHKWTGADVLANLVKWQHVAPNCPDTLDAFPMAERDPLVMETTPHIIVCGNQPQAEFRRVPIDGSDSTCLVVCLPKFSKTRVACFLNLKDLSMKWQNFDHQY